MKQQVPINPALLRWARCAAGLSLKDAAARAKITALRRPKNQTSVTPEDRLASWEDGRTMFFQKFSSKNLQAGRRFEIMVLHQLYKQLPAC